MRELDTDTRQRLKDLAQKKLMLIDEFRVTPWMNVLPIWNFISKQPFFRSLVVSAVMLAIVLVANLDKLEPRFILKQFLVSVEISIAFYMVYYFSNKTNELYRHLSLITLLPKDTFRRWFSERVSVVWGCVNLLSNESRRNYKFKDFLKKDKKILIWYSAANFFMPLLLFKCLNLPKFQLSFGTITQYIFIFLGCYSFLWILHWVWFGIFSFILSLSKLPVRYFYGIPDVLTLKGTGNIVAQMQYANTLHFWFFLLVLYFWEVIPHQISKTSEINPIVLLSFIILLTVYLTWQFMGVIVTQIVISINMRSYKIKRLAEYSYHLEEKHTSFMKHPSSKNFSCLQETNNNMKLLHKMPTIGLTPGYFIINFFVFVLTIFPLLFYFKITFHGWQNLFDIIRVFLP